MFFTGDCIPTSGSSVAITARSARVPRKTISNGHLAQLLFVRVKLPERELEHTSITTAEVNKAGNVHVTLH